MDILLFDMDSVLIEPRGYHRALQDTVMLTGRALGYQDIRLTQQDIDHFEAVGATSEWDSSAICAALLLEKVWEINPSIRVPMDFPKVMPPAHNLTPPDFQGFAKSIHSVGSLADPIMNRVEKVFLSKRQLRPTKLMDTLLTILHQARDVRYSPTHRLFQELILGSQTYQDLYGLPPLLNAQSYLKNYDQPTLSPRQKRRLITWLSKDSHEAAIFTNRPNKWTYADHNIDPPHNMALQTENLSLLAPDAEIGARLAGLQDLPLIGFGSLAWLSGTDGAKAGEYAKPSPVHVLAALGSLLEDDLVRALHMAKQLYEGQADPLWRQLSGARIRVFEDSAKGMISALEAKAHLETIGLKFEMTLFGIAKNPAKRTALADVGAALYPDLATGLGEIIGG